MVTTATRPPSPAQLRYLYALAGERVVPSLGSCGEERIENLGARVENEHPSMAKVSLWIDWLKRQPRENGDRGADLRGAADVDPNELQVGVYRRDGRVYVVRWNKERTRKYALVAVESTERLTEAGTIIEVDFEYERGAIFRLRPEHRDRKSTRLNSRHVRISYAVFCLKKKKIVRMTPFEQILLETDAPFLTPVPYRGRETAPFYLPFVAEKIADVK